MDTQIAREPANGPVDANASRLHDAFSRLREGLSETNVGQSALVERLLIALVADGLLLVVGAPVLARVGAP